MRRFVVTCQPAPRELTSGSHAQLHSWLYPHLPVKKNARLFLCLISLGLTFIPIKAPMLALTLLYHCYYEFDILMCVLTQERSGDSIVESGLSPV